jgi:pimeloyl-ACP methyl ester carboxylesterase
MLLQFSIKQKGEPVSTKNYIKIIILRVNMIILQLSLVIDLFNHVIEKPGARHAFESAFYNSTTTKIESERLMQIKNIPCLIIWGTQDNLIPIEYADKFIQVLQHAEFEKIGDAGHSPFVEKTAKVYERIRTFLIK